MEIHLQSGSIFQPATLVSLPECIRCSNSKSRGNICFKELPQSKHHFLLEGVVLLMAEIRLTTWDVRNPKDNGKNYLSTGAGFQPSTVGKW